MFKLYHISYKSYCVREITKIKDNWNYKSFVTHQKGKEIRVKQTYNHSYITKEYCFKKFIKRLQRKKRSNISRINYYCRRLHELPNTTVTITMLKNLL